MTWSCPYCDHAYPDSALGVPLGVDADDKAYCTRCAVDPLVVEALVEEYRARANGDTEVEYERRAEWREVAYELEALLE